MGENVDEGLPLSKRNPDDYRLGNINIQKPFRRLRGEAAAGVRVAVGIGQVGLDVENRRPVHQIGTGDVQHRA